MTTATLTSRLDIGAHQLTGKAPAPKLVTAATAAWRAATVEDDGRSLTDLTGGGRHLLPGGVAGATPTSNDPRRLEFTGERYLYLPGISGASASVPDEAAFGITGDLELQWLGEIHTSSGCQFMGQWSGSSAWLLEWIGSTLRLHHSDGTTRFVTANAAPVGDVSAEGFGVKVTHRLSDGRVQFFETADDGGTWSQIGIDLTLAAGLARINSTSPVTIGALGTGSAPLTGRLRRAVIKDGIDGDTVLDVDFTRTDLFSAPYTSGTAVTGQTVTLNGRATLVTSPRLFLDGVDDWLSVADDDVFDVGAADDLTVVAVVRWANLLTEIVASKREQAGTGFPGWVLYFNSAQQWLARVGDGTNDATAIVAAAGKAEVQVVSFVLDRTAGTLTIDVDGTEQTVSAATVGSLANAQPLRAFARGDLGGQFLTGQGWGLSTAVDRVLTAAQRAQVGRELAYGEASVV